MTALRVLFLFLLVAFAVSAEKPKLVEGQRLGYTIAGAADPDNQRAWLLGEKWRDLDLTDFNMLPSDLDVMGVPHDSQAMRVLLLSDERAPMATHTLLQRDGRLVAQQVMILLDSTQPGVPHQWGKTFLGMLEDTFGAPQFEDGTLTDWNRLAVWFGKDGAPDVMVTFKLEGCIIAWIQHDDFVKLAETAQ